VLTLARLTVITNERSIIMDLSFVITVNLARVSTI
jgi:hypothetical protein